MHRLDRDTSGLLLFAKSAEAAGTLTHAFRTRAVTKYYTGLTVRRSAKKMGTVVGDMEKGRGCVHARAWQQPSVHAVNVSRPSWADPYRRGSYMLTRGKENPAVTRFVTWGLPSLGLRAFVCRPETGKTHQIRVARRSMQAPVLGDARYGTVRDARSEWEARRGADVDVAAGELWGDAPCGDGTAQLGWDRMYLHACAVRVRLPDETISLVCPPTHGALFTHPAFEAWFQGQFAGPMAGDECWFPDSPLLTSSNGGGPRHEH